MSFLEYMVAAIFIYDFQSIFLTSSSKAFGLATYFLLVIMFVLLFAAIINAPFKSFQAKDVLLAIIFITYNLMFLFVNAWKTNGLSYISRFIVFFILLFLYCMLLGKKGNLYGVLHKFSNLMIILAFVSVLFWVFGSLLHWISPSGTAVINWGTLHSVNSYHSIYFETQHIDLLNTNIIRNSSIFSEAPMFSAPLCISMAYEVLIRNQKRKKCIVILAVAILSTFSTSGLIVLVILWFVNYYINFIQPRLKGSLKYLIFFLCFFIMLFVVYFIMQGKQDTSSFLVRSDDYKAGFLAWLRNPIFGTGYNSYDMVRQYVMISRVLYGKSIGTSNSIIQILSQGGIWLGIFYFLPFLLSSYQAIKTKQYSNLFFNLIILVLFVTTVFSYCYITINMIALWWTQYLVEYRKYRTSHYFRSREACVGYDSYKKY